MHTVTDPDPLAFWLFGFFGLASTPVSPSVCPFADCLSAAVYATISYSHGEWAESRAGVLETDQHPPRTSMWLALPSKRTAQSMYAAG